MEEDVTDSYDSIVNETPDVDYNSVMSHYRGCLMEVENRVPVPELQQPLLPSIENMERVIAEYLNKDNRGAHFSFDSSARQPFE